MRVGSINAAIYTSPHATADLDPEPALLNLINSAKTSIVFSAYSFTLAPLAQAIIAKHQAGVTVQGVMDASEYAAGQGPVMYAAGVDLKVWGSQYDLAHEKVFIVDGKALSLGSFNATNSAEKVNREVLLVASGVQVARVLAPVLTAQIQATYAVAHTP